MNSRTILRSYSYKSNIGTKGVFWLTPQRETTVRHYRENKQRKVEAVGHVTHSGRRDQRALTYTE